MVNQFFYNRKRNRGGLNHFFLGDFLEEKFIMKNFEGIEEWDRLTSLKKIVSFFTFF